VVKLSNLDLSNKYLWFGAVADHIHFSLVLVRTGAGVVDLVVGHTRSKEQFDP
jgi:hypothetical protein